MKFVPLIVAAIALLLAPLVWLGGRALLSSEGGGGLSLDGPSVDSAARIEIEMLRTQIEALNEKITALERQVATIGAVPLAPDPQGGIIPRDGPNQIIDAYAQVVLIAQRTQVNRELTVATPDFLEELLGRPRDALSDECQGITNNDLESKMVLTQVGPVRVNMLRAAAESLGQVLDRIRQADSDLYDRINTSGSLCVRQIRGTTGRLSSHSFGTAIDLNIDGHLDNFTDGKTQLGLTILADFFRDAGWIWGAGFQREDSMHFEVSRELLEQWQREGRL